MKQYYTIKGLSELTHLAAGTIRAWIMKPIDGQPYSSENINYANLVEKLNKYYEDFEDRFGFKAEDIEITKAERSKKSWLTPNEIEDGAFVILHNYSLKTKLMFVKYIADLDLYIFSTTEGDSAEEPIYKAYTTAQLMKENIKIEKVEA